MTREEAIHRWVLPAIKNTWNEKRCKEILKALEQEPKTGHWIATEDGFECSECGCISRSRANFCQYCGAKMVEPQESEDK